MKNLDSFKVRGISVEGDIISLGKKYGDPIKISVHQDEAKLIEILLNKKIDDEDRANLLKNFLKLKKIHGKVIDQVEKIEVSKTLGTRWRASVVCSEGKQNMTPGSGIIVALLKQMPIYMKTLTRKEEVLYKLTKEK